MPTFRVRQGEVLAHDGKVQEAGDVIELSRAVADDPAVRGAIEEVDAAGNPVAPVPVDELARFRTHERVSILRTRLADAQAGVSRIQAQLDAEEARLANEVTAAAAARTAASAAGGKRSSGKDTAPAPDSPVS